MMLVEEAIGTEHLELTGAVKGAYAICERRPDGNLLIAPDTSWKAILGRAGARKLSPGQWERFLAEHGDMTRPADDVELVS